MSMKLYVDCIEFPLFICTLIHLKFHISTEIKETCLQPSKLREIFSQTRTNVKQQINFLQRCENLVWIFLLIEVNILIEHVTNRLCFC